LLKTCTWLARNLPFVEVLRRRGLELVVAGSSG
jgi:hypothetical protein